jgi:hypothetical protein
VRSLPDKPFPRFIGSPVFFRRATLESIVEAVNAPHTANMWAINVRYGQSASSALQKRSFAHPPRLSLNPRPPRRRTNYQLEA